MSERVTVTRLAAGLLGAVLLAGCQTVGDAAQGSFTQAQRAVLEREGFTHKGDGYELGLENRVLFEFDRSDLKSDTRAMLVRLGKVLREVGIRSATVEGHADAAGSESYNRQLSQLRAAAVKQTLVFAGLDERRTRSWGVGENDPIASNATAQGRSENRRVVIVVTPGDAARL